MNKLDAKLKSKLLPFVLTIVVIVMDQITKMLIVRYLPIQPGSPMSFGPSFFGDFLRIIHIRNTGVAFSFGAEWSLMARRIFFSVVPTVLLIGVIIVYFKSEDFTKVQRWTLAGIVGGGFGNIIDRIFRADGVVDFIDIKFYGLFGFERWPTFNIADSAVVVCGIILFISIIRGMIIEEKQKKQAKSKK